MNRRPLSILLIACLYIATGALGLVSHLMQYEPRHPFDNSIVWISVISLLAAVAGAYMLRGSDWARWLALAWIAFHVVVSAFHSRYELAAHSVLCALLAYFLFRPAATRYFRADRSNAA